MVCRGVDMSAVTGALVAAATGTTSGGQKVLFDSCKIAAAVARYSGTPVMASDEVELINCYDGTKFVNERYTPAGALTTDTSTTLVGGAADDVGGFSHKLVSSSRSDMFGLPLESFWLDVENTAIGSAVTATVEVVSSASLNNTDIHMILEYQGTAGSALASFGDSLASVLTASSAVTASSASWNNPPSTPQYQKLTVAFTPQTAGRVRARVLLGKASTTVWVNPQVTIS